MITGLQEAALRFYPEPGSAPRLLLHPSYPFLQGEFLRVRRRDQGPAGCLEAGPCSGDVLVSW